MSGQGHRPEDVGARPVLPPDTRYRKWLAITRDEKGAINGLQLRCPYDHHIRAEDSFAIEHLGLRCRHISPRDPARRECGIILYFFARADYPKVFFAEVTLDEMRVIQRLRTVHLILAFLGAELPDDFPANAY